VAPPEVPSHTPEFTRWASSPKGDEAVIDGAKALALTALDLMGDRAMLDAVKADFAATSEQSRKALGSMLEPAPGAHAHGGCGGCA
jgi:hypothetical protein